MPSKRVLIATDFGSDSALIAKLGVSVARALGAEPVFLHVQAFPPPSPSSFYPEASRALHYQAMLDLQRLVSACALANDDVQLLVRSGHAAAVIRDTARELAASLIVVGTRRAHGVERWLVGSVAERVARHAECPVMVVPCEATPRHGPRKAVAS